MAKKVSKKLIEEDEIETYKDETTERLDLEFLIDYVYKKEYILEDNRHCAYTLHSLESILLIVILQYYQIVILKKIERIF